MNNCKPSLRARAAAELELRRRKQRETFGGWLSAVSPSWHWEWHHLAFIREALDRIVRGESDRLILSLPPRHGKSEQVTVRFPVWLLERDPARRFIVGAHTARLSETFSRKARRVAGSRLTFADDRNAVTDWETVQGGGFRAVGVGGSPTGQGADGIVIDDPVKSREEADSKVYRDKVWNWFCDDMYTRLEPGGWIAVITTRWHEDDVVGRLLEAQANGEGDKWEVINLPALAEEDDPLGRLPGEALCPERYDVEALERIKKVLGRSFHALYQGRPQPKSGEFFLREWFPIVDAAPVEATRVRYWDKAASADGDFTTGVKMCKTKDGIYYVENVVRGQWRTGEREKVSRQTAEIDGIATPIVMEQEPGSSGVDSANYTIKNLAGFRATAQTSTGDKVVRAGPFAAQAEAGNVRLVRGPWNAAYIDELCLFPRGKNDDQVDGSSGAFNHLAKARTLGVY